MTSAVLLLAVVTLTMMLPSTAAKTWDNEVVLAADGSVRLKWRIHDGNITCRLDAVTLGWVGFGLSPNGGMKNSDMIVAGIKDGQPYLVDMHSADSYQLIADRRQVTHLVMAWEDSASTVVVFTRPLTPSCGPDHVPGENRDITDDTQRVLFAYHEEDPARLDAPPRHQHRGQRSVHLTDPATGMSPPPPPPPQAAAPADPQLTWSLTMDRAALPDESTVYWCRVVRAPRLTSKHHAIKFRALIQPGHERVVHHMLVYQCSGHDFSDLGEHADADVGGGYRCYSPNMPSGARKCRGIIAGWAIGGEDFNYPEIAGYPMGPDDGADFYILEIHYDIQDRTGVVDSSGLEFTLTSRTRPEDASLFVLGHDISQLQLIPPGQRVLPVAGHCSDECLDLALPDDGVTLFAAIPHTHLLGRQIRLRHFRNGTEVLPPVFRDDNYDFNYQQMRHVPPRRVRRGDQLTVECIYSSTDRVNVTLGGRATEEEMCISFVLYYPAVQLAQCVSTPLPGPLLSALEITDVRRSWRHNLVVTSPAEFEGQTLQQYASRLDWTEERLASVNAAAWRGTHVPECYAFGRHVLKTTRNTTGYPAGVAPQGRLDRQLGCELTAAGATLLPSNVLTAAAIAATLYR